MSYPLIPHPHSFFHLHSPRPCIVGNDARRKSRAAIYFIASAQYYLNSVGTLKRYELLLQSPSTCSSNGNYRVDVPERPQAPPHSSTMRMHPAPAGPADGVDGRWGEGVGRSRNHIALGESPALLASSSCYGSSQSQNPVPQPHPANARSAHHPSPAPSPSSLAPWTPPRLLRGFSAQGCLL